MEMVDAIINVVKRAGNSLLLVDDAERSVSTKEGRANFVTKYDVAVQNYLKEELLKILPEAAFIGEEGDDKSALGTGYAFIVDPIDGTTNFIKNYGKSCVSVGLLYKGDPVMGFVYNPYTNHMYHAEKGKGAFMNYQPIHASKHGLSDGLILFGTAPYYQELFDRSYELVKTLHKAGMDIRRSGSAALDLCDIAAGRAEIFVELMLQPWDYVAGCLIVTEAGGIVTRTNKEPLCFDHGCSVLACSPKTYEDYFALPGHAEMG